MRQPIDHAAKQDPSAGKGFKTPLKVIRGLGSAGAGTEDMIRQRITALANAVLVIFLAGIAIALSGMSYANAVALVGSTWVAVPLALAILSVTLHMKLGVQLVIEDYVHADILRIALMAALNVFAAAVALTALYAIVRVSLAGLVLAS
ncbi:succinate dehydrogenase, hydrophobic membrane anchor protein [Acuticoccus sp.]|uniref:succinate dehydrogenase, hydrophobic membrane anchor protein n=1 Tax=Acuticoccus sp. TaxID=1904378 RepID=UPI003B52A2BC